MAKKPNAPAPVAPVAAPVILYVAVGPKRGLTGTGGGKYENAATMAAFQALPNSQTGLPLEAYHSVAKARNHKGFTSYAVKYGWLAKVPVSSALVAGPV